MRCIEMVHPVTSGTQTLKINRNMRCIEIMMDINMNRVQREINRNMRCIEIAFWLSLLHSDMD